MLVVQNLLYELYIRYSTASSTNGFVKTWFIINKLEFQLIRLRILLLKNNSPTPCFFFSKLYETYQISKTNPEDFFYK